MTKRLTPDQETEIRSFLEERSYLLFTHGECLLRELDAVRVELKEERRLSDLLNVQNAELMRRE